MVIALTKYYSNCFVIIMDELPTALIQVVVLNSVKCQREELFCEPPYSPEPPTYGKPPLLVYINVYRE